MRFDVVRAWKDPDYRENLEADERALLPANPAGLIELVDQELSLVAGARNHELENNSTIIVSAALCYSILVGGTCEVGTQGCCNALPVDYI